MLQIGTLPELHTNTIPAAIYNHLEQNIALLDEFYGTDRDYNQIGGYALIAEDHHDIATMKALVHADSKPYEWQEVVGNYIATLYLLNDDYSVLLYIPTHIKHNYQKGN